MNIGVLLFTMKKCYDPLQFRFGSFCGRLVWFMCIYVSVNGYAQWKTNKSGYSSMYTQFQDIVTCCTLPKKIRRKKKLCLKYDKLFASKCALIINNFSLLYYSLWIVKKIVEKFGKISTHTHRSYILVCAFMFANGSSLFIKWQCARAIFFFFFSFSLVISRLKIWWSFRFLIKLIARKKNSRRSHFYSVHRRHAVLFFYLIIFNIRKSRVSVWCVCFFWPLSQFLLPGKRFLLLFVALSIRWRLFFLFD